MRKHMTLTIIDIVVYILWAVLGFFIMIMILMTMPFHETKFSNTSAFILFIFVALIHIAAGTIVSTLAYKKGLLKGKIHISKWLMVFNIFLSVIPYLALISLEFIGDLI